MEEKKFIKISLSTLLLIISIIIILVMGYFLYNSNYIKNEMISNEQNLNEKIEELQNQLANKENGNKTSKISFSEIMNMLYTKNETKIGENICYTNPNDSVYYIIPNTSENITNVESTFVRIFDKEINFYMLKTESDIEIDKTITGITEEVVSIKILQNEMSATPKAVYFLTRNGNIYYIDENMIATNNFDAKKISNLSEIVSIETLSITYEGAMHGDTTLIATTYNGEKIDVSEYIK